MTEVGVPHCARITPQHICCMRHYAGVSVITSPRRALLVSPDRLRFDISHPRAISAEELHDVECEVNRRIRLNTPVETRLMTPDEAIEQGAMALFGEKYGDEVRVVTMGGNERASRLNFAAAHMCRGPAISASSV